MGNRSVIAIFITQFGKASLSIFCGRYKKITAA